MTSDWRGGVSPSNPPQMSHLGSPDDGDTHARRRNDQTGTLVPSDRPGEFAVPAAPVSLHSARGLATTASSDLNGINNKSPEQQLRQETTQHSTAMMDGTDSSSQSLPRSALNSQESAMTASTDLAVTPPASDASATNGISHQKGPSGQGPATQSSQLLQLSAIAAAQHRMMGDGGRDGTRKRMADGEVKLRPGSTSPVKGHSRNTSAVSMASTTGSNIGELSAELKTRLSYAMVKVNHGWQSRSLDEVESLASKGASPTSSTSTIHRRSGSSASPRLPTNATAAAQVHFAQDPVTHRRKSNSPLGSLSNRPMLAPPASIEPATSMPAPGGNRRRNSNPRYTPTMLSHAHSQSHSGSPQTPSEPMRLDTNQPRPRGVADPILYSPHQNVREQDAIETLLFMSSPGNSANLKHSFSPSGSPGPPTNTGTGPPGRHVLPGAPRKGLPSQRPGFPNKKANVERSPGMPPPGSPMDVDSPQQLYHSPNRGTPRRRINGAHSHLRGALSLPSGLGVVTGNTRKTLRDEDIERMLDRAGAEAADSSDDEEIQLPRGRNGVAGVMGV